MLKECVALMAAFVSVAAGAADLNLYAAGSLSGAMGELSAAFSQKTGIAVHGVYGPSGMLRERIEAGEAVDVFASADMGHPRKLVQNGRAEFVVRFTANRLCALATPALGLNADNFLDKALNPQIKLGTSTPLADPAGDYTWAMFEQAEALHPGAAASLKAKALQLVGGPQAEKIPAGHGAVPYMFATGKADMFMAYCTTAKQAADEGLALTAVPLPATLAPRAEYGMVVLKNAKPEAGRLALYILSEEGQRILAKWGFDVGLSPTP